MHHGQSMVSDEDLPSRHAVAGGLSPPVVLHHPALTLRYGSLPIRKRPVRILRIVIGGRSSAPPLPSRWSSRHVSLDHHPIRNGGVLDDDDNTVADDKAQVFLVGLLHVVLVHDPDMTSDPGVFVDNGFGDRRVGPHP
jgi:hypothetical protein